MRLNARAGIVETFFHGLQKALVAAPCVSITMFSGSALRATLAAKSVDVMHAAIANFERV
jgi:aspartate aminotransferase-like enzyme